MIEGRLDWTPEVEEPLYDCLLCGACTSNCFPAIPTSDLVIRARSEYLQRVGRKSAHRMLFDHLLPYPHRLHTAARAVALGEKTGVTFLARSLGLMKVFGRDISRTSEIIGSFPLQPFRTLVKPGTYTGTGRSLRLGYFVGCGMDMINHDAARSTFRLLRKAAKTVVVLDNCCCGLPAWSYGDLQSARKLAEKNLLIPSLDKCDLIVTDCSSCASHLKRMPEIFEENDERYIKAKNMAGRVQDFIEFMANEELSANHPPAKISVTYHDPCHASRGQSLIGQPRELLKKYPGVEFREMEEADWCCGGAGAYAFSHFDLAQSVLSRKIANIRKTEADLVVTSCPSCIMHLSFGLRTQGMNMKVCHLSEVMDSDSGVIG
jgi:glycolate oxidase iron-sulfur subunit